MGFMKKAGVAWHDYSVVGCWQRVYRTPCDWGARKFLISVNEETFDWLREGSSGFCAKCGFFDGGGHCPSVRDQECGNCGEDSSHGMHAALDWDLVEILDDAELDKLQGTSEEISI